jgi:hypothetical protein
MDRPKYYPLGGLPEMEGRQESSPTSLGLDDYHSRCLRPFDFGSVAREPERR